MSWRALEAGAPELARVGRELLEGPGVALLGTLRSDGSPRVSPVEPVLAGGELVFGVMVRSAKARDLVRDPRCVLHSAIAAPNAGVPELKLYGRVTEAADPPRGWWTDRPAGDAHVYALAVEQAVLVEWSLAEGRMTVHSWSPAAGAALHERSYP